MIQERFIIGVMGGNKQSDLAEAIGAEITARRHVVLTGGKPLKNSEQTTQRVPWGALQYAKRDSQTIARIIGVIPNNSTFKESVSWDDSGSNEHSQQLIINTQLLGYERNVLNASIPAVLIVLRGKEGTLSEAAFGYHLGKPIIFADSIDYLRDRKDKMEQELDLALGTAFSAYPSVLGKSLQPHLVKDSLVACLGSSALNVYDPNMQKLAEKAVDQAINAIKSNLPVQICFPGIKHDNNQYSFLHSINNVLK